mmetsp:Transcript_49280/g.86760  ORF Transcript_49280/g.86760 Transcript_49280/m.86760 type:complete len:327 (+) Transcript_49280:71-1051(+)
MWHGGHAASEVPTRHRPALAFELPKVLATAVLLLSTTPACSASFLRLRGAEHAENDGRVAASAPLMDDSVLSRAQQALAVAASADAQAQQSSQAVLVHQQGLVAVMASDSAEEAYEKTRPLVPEAQAGMTEARLWAMKAAKYAAHAKQVALATRTIAVDAAEKAKEAVQGWIREDASKAAEAAANHAASTNNEARVKKIANAVAAAAEPYHLAFLRSQKFVAETESKAKSALESAQNLKEKAEGMAQTAQKMQDQRLGLQAQQMMSAAHGTMSQAENMRNWALKLWNQANDVNQGLGYYQLSEGQAAANAAATFVMNAPAVLPPAA